MGVTCHACIGGTGVRADIQKLERGVQIIVGTPGRVKDMIKRGALGESRSSLIFQGHTKSPQYKQFMHYGS